ncbi:Retinol dehydrogenase 11 [Papilio xuthus]|uniref:Retinol dehydrogenase 11 n=1 Tax=Papilio xuthus TaxID=66420 RepID=A0A0N1ICN4_PAPXU|nr:Retinol dehydrogenase 11 [Papilio xuthus]
MFLLSLIILLIFTYGFLYVYLKLTSGICKCSKHLVGKVVIVTGGNNGIGFETAKDLAERGARVILACRDESRGIAARDKIIATSGNNDVYYRHLDLASLTSVKKFADEFIREEKCLDILINNAGINGSRNVRTEDGLLLGMQTNHFAPFLLTCLLFPLLKSSASGRIINVSSMAHNRATLDLDNLNMEKETEETYSKTHVYAVSKLCNILFTVELSKRLKGTKVTTNSLHPGVVDTDILDEIYFKYVHLLKALAKPLLKNRWEGAQTTIYLAVSPEVENVSGKYFRDCKMVNVGTDQARDVELARKLWEISEKLLNFKSNF